MTTAITDEMIVRLQKRRAGGTSSMKPAAA